MEHFGDINRKDPQKPLEAHFCRQGHPDIQILEIRLLTFIKLARDSPQGQRERDFHELQWIHCLKFSRPPEFHLPLHPCVYTH